MEIRSCVSWDDNLVFGIGELVLNHRDIMSNAVFSRSPSREAVDCTKCTIWLYVAGTDYVETTGVFLPGTFDMLPGGALQYT